MSKKYSLSPTFLLAKTKNAPTQIQADKMFEYNSKLWFSGGYRLNDAIVISAGVSFASVKIGYSYDITISKLRGNLGNTHEVIIGFNRTKKNFDWYTSNKRKRRL